jgi:hypothetical protein
MAELTDAMIDAAEARGRELLATEPQARSAHYDRESGRVVIELASGCAYMFPAEMIEDLHGATPDQLAQIEVDGLGFNLHWPALDADLYVPALVAGLFGTQRWMTRALARIAGSSRSQAKTAAARSNGARGGRPRKSATR